MLRDASRWRISYRCCGLFSVLIMYIYLLTLTHFCSTAFKLLQLNMTITSFKKTKKEKLKSKWGPRHSESMWSFSGGRVWASPDSEDKDRQAGRHWEPAAHQPPAAMDLA